MSSKFVPLFPVVRSIGRLLTPLPLAALLFTATAVAQVDQGSISGTITDASGAVIPGAKVTLVDTDTNLTLTRMTSNGGVYTFTPVKVGEYTLRVDAPRLRRYCARTFVWM